MPGETTTKMLGKFETDHKTISAERAAEVCFRDLGTCMTTRGALRHELHGWLGSFKSIDTQFKQLKSA